jgi:hypothetical protein
MQQRQLFEDIFSDAHIIDIDLSAWDQVVKLYVITDHAPRTTPGRLPLFMVEFLRVRQWNMSFNHLEVTFHELGPDEHLQWRSDSWEIDTNERELLITLSGSGYTPRITIVCADVSIQEIAYAPLDRYFPGWSRPGRGLVRPSIEQYVQDVEARKRNTRT